MTTVEIGRAAEQRAAEHLQARGFTLLGRNWRNRWCEIDIIARRASSPGGISVVHFVEVKYRKDVRYGYASEYISRDKSARLVRAALAWCQAHNYSGAYQIDVVTVEGPALAPVIAHLENVIN